MQTSAACATRAGPRLRRGQDLVDAGDAVTHRFLRVALQVQIERRVDIELAGRRHAPGSRVERVGDVVDEIRRFVVDGARDDGNRFLLRALAASP
jgi:hypothetical protein